MVSPRLGFRWDIAGDKRYILRGGAGIFTGRIPFVWLSNNFTNTGVRMESYYVKNNKDVSLILDPNRQSENAENLKADGNQVINVFDKDFKFAQNFRLNLGFDFEALGINWTAEAIYSKTLNDVYYRTSPTRRAARRSPTKRASPGTTVLSTSAHRRARRSTTSTCSATPARATPTTSRSRPRSTSTSASTSWPATASRSRRAWVAPRLPWHRATGATPTPTAEQPSGAGQQRLQHPARAEGFRFLPHRLRTQQDVHHHRGSDLPGIERIALLNALQRRHQRRWCHEQRPLLHSDGRADRPMPFKATKALSADQQRANLKTWLANTPLPARPPRRVLQALRRQPAV